MARTAALLLALVAAAALASPALAQPCIPCRDCRTNNCLSVCQRECPRPSPVVVVNGVACQRYGQDVGVNIGRAACDLTQQYCRGGQRAMVTSRRFVPVTLSQCGNIIYGQCQASATNTAKSWNSRCRWSFNGFEQCTRQQFETFFNGEVNERCNNKATAVTGPSP